MAGQVIVVFPHSGLQNTLTDSHRRWLSRGTVRIKSVATEPLCDVLSEIGLPLPPNGLAALRYLGQTGGTAAGWIAAADPITFEPRMRDIVARRIPSGQMDASELQDVILAAQDLIADDEDMRLESCGNYAYLNSAKPMPTATVSPTTLHGNGPDDYLPSGYDGATFHRIHSELQMLFHDHPVNERRVARGLSAINGLWIWGGGQLPNADIQQLPELLGDDPLFTGYWEHFGGTRQAWSDDIADFVSAASSRAVITVPESSDGAFDEVALGHLEQLSGMVKSRRIIKLTLIFNNEVVSRIRWADGFKFWRRQSVLQPEGMPHE